jgi:hypothetical protein
MAKKNPTTRQSKGKVRQNILERINLHAAGIDIGANFHFVAVGEECAEENVRKFDAFTSDLHRMADWLSEHHIQTVVMESTGVYWIPGVPDSGATRIGSKIGQCGARQEFAWTQKRRLGLSMAPTAS